MNQRLRYDLSADSLNQLTNNLSTAGYTIEAFGNVDVAPSRRRADANFPVNEAFPGVTVPVAHIGGCPYGGARFIDIVNTHLSNLARYHAEIRRLAA